MAEVFRILDATSRETIPNPMELAIGRDRTVHLPPNCMLVRRDGLEIPIEDSVAPIHDREGQATGAVIVFRDVSAARAMALQMAHSAEHDFLTGLPNRMLLNDRISQAIALAPRHDEAGRGAVPGPRRLQAHQRFAGPSDRRQAAAVDRRAPGRLRARVGHGQPPGRRRVRRAALRGRSSAEDAAIVARRMLQAVAEAALDRPARAPRHHQHRRQRLSRRRRSTPRR